MTAPDPDAVAAPTFDALPAGGFNRTVAGIECGHVHAFLVPDRPSIAEVAARHGIKVTVGADDPLVHQVPPFAEDSDRPATATGEREKCPVCHGEGLVECRDALQCLRPHYDGWHPCRDCDGFGERPIVVLTDDHEVCDQQLRAERAARAEEVGRLMVIVKRTAGMGPCSQEHHEVLVAAARAALGDR